MIACAALFTACKKDKVEEPAVVPVTPQKTVAQKITTKWDITTIEDNDFYNNTPHSSIYNGVPTDYLDFRNDGKLYIQIMPFGKDTLLYNLLTDSTINLEGDIFKIKTITDTKFVLYLKETYSTAPIAFYETTISLAK